MSTAIVAQAEGTLTEELDDEFPIDLAQLRPIPMRKSLLLINNFVTNTTRFLNHFSHVCEEKLLHVSTKLMKLEIKLALLEAKLNSIPDLEDTPVEEQDDVLADGTMPGFVRPDEPSLAGEGSEIAPPPPPPTTEKNEAPKLPELALVPLPPPPPPILSDVVPPSPPAIPDLDLDDGASEAPSDIGIPPPPSLPPRSMMMEEIASRAPPALEESVSDPAATTIPPPPPPALSALESLSLMSEEVESSLPVEDDEFSEEEEEEIPSPSSFLKLKDDPEFSKYVYHSYEHLWGISK